jgi:TldD protein
MLDSLKSMVMNVDADYADIRYERKKDVIIHFVGKELHQVSSNATDGYVLRVLKHGGISSIAFTKEDDADTAISSALHNAALIAAARKTPIHLAPAPVVKDAYVPAFKEDPRHISLDEKLDIARRYNAIPMLHAKIATTDISYHEVIREKFFVSTEGSEIREELITNRISGLIVSSDGSHFQNIRVGVGGSSGFSVLRDREADFEKRTSVALQLLDARPVKGGVYNVILNQSLAGVFTHEAFGHFSEADLIENNPSMRKKMRLNARLGNHNVNIIDNPTLTDQLGHYKYDDEGFHVQPTQLMKNGVLVGRLHSRRTAAVFNEPPNGHSVAEDYRYAPIIRMGTIFIEPGVCTFEDLMNMLDNGLYILDAKGGQTGGENFTFGAQYGYVVKNGRINEMVKDINMSGNLYETLRNIDAVGDDLKLSEIGGCGKGQLNIRSCYGAPHVFVKNIVIGGV